MERTYALWSRLTGRREDENRALGSDVASAVLLYAVFQYHGDFVRRITLQIGQLVRRVREIADSLGYPAGYGTVAVERGRQTKMDAVLRSTEKNGNVGRGPGGPRKDEREREIDRGHPNL